MSGDKEYDVFLSHSSKDKAFVRRLQVELESNGIEVWLDEIEMSFGDSLFDHIAKGIEKARYFVIVLSKPALESKWVRNELKAALTREMEEDRTFVIPILIEDIDVPTFLGDKIYADFRSEENFDASLQGLVNKIRVKSSRESVDAKQDGKAILYPDQFLPNLRFFVGRRDLLENIRKTLDSVHRAVIHNISGLGKTFTAYKYASENEKGYEKIFLVRATKEEWLESLAKNGEAVDPELAKLTEQEAKVAGFKEWLERNRNWLVIYDNVDLPEQLFPFVPVTGNGDCLFTSNYAESVMIGAEVGIVKMGNAEAGRLLYSRSLGKPDAEPDLKGKEKEAFDDLLKEIDGLPVTLTSTGAVIFKKQWSFERSWKEYNKTPEIAWDSEDSYSPYQNRSAGRIFSLIYDELCAAEDTGKAVRIILDSVSFISPDEIPEDLLQEILKEQYSPYSEAREPDDLWDDVRDKLTAYDLLKYDRDKRTFTTHRAIQRVIQSGLKRKEKDICIALASVLTGLFPLYDYLNQEDCEKYYQHVLVLVENADRFDAETEDTNSLYFRLGRYQGNSGNYALAERYNLRAADISAAVFGVDSASHATALNDLAVVYRYQGRNDEAIEKHKDALEIREKALGKEHLDYAQSLNNLAIVYRSHGRYAEAIEKYEEAMLIDEKTIGKEHPDYAIDLNNLATVYFAQGDLERAEELHQQSKEIREKMLGKMHPSTAISYWWLGVLRAAQGRHAEGLPMFEEAYRQFVHFLGEEHPNTHNLKIHLENCREKIKKS